MCEPIDCLRYDSPILTALQPTQTCASPFQLRLMTTSFSHQYTHQESRQGPETSGRPTRVSFLEQYTRRSTAITIFSATKCMHRPGVESLLSTPKFQTKQLRTHSKMKKKKQFPHKSSQYFSRWKPGKQENEVRARKE